MNSFLRKGFENVTNIILGFWFQTPLFGVLLHNISMPIWPGHLIIPITYLGAVTFMFFSYDLFINTFLRHLIGLFILAAKVTPFLALTFSLLFPIISEFTTL